MYKTVPINSLINTENMKGEIFTVNWNDTTAKSISVDLNEIINESVVIENSNSEFDNVIIDGVEYLYEGAKLKVLSNSEVGK